MFDHFEECATEGIWSVNNFIYQVGSTMQSPQTNSRIELIGHRECHKMTDLQWSYKVIENDCHKKKVYQQEIKFTKTNLHNSQSLISS